MSMKLRTLAVTCLARSFSSFEPGAAFCLRRFAIVVLACLTAAVPGPSLAGAGAGVGAGACLAPPLSGPAAARPGASRQGAADEIRRATMSRRDMGLLMDDAFWRGIHPTPAPGVP